MANDSSGDLLTEVQEIRAHIERMDKRDRLRTSGAFFKNIIMMIPVFLFIFGAWYLSKNWESIISDIATKSAEQATSTLDQQMEGMLNRFGGGHEGTTVDPQ